MKNYLSNWNFMRILRLALGVFIIVQGIITKEWMFALLGGLFALLPILNVGCCGTSACNVPNARNNKNVDDVSFEEIK